MSDLKLRALKAKHGDALFLFADEITILIDGGPSGVYNRTLREQLNDLERDGDDEPRIDLMMVSHIDADHIDGILDLTSEMVEAREEESEPIVRIDRAWHNSFSDTLAKAGVVKPSRINASAAAVASAFDSFEGPDFDPQESKLVLSSVAQGRQLRRDLKKLNIDTNKRFEDQVVLQGGVDKPLKLGRLTLSVIGPAQKQLDALREDWKNKLKTILKKAGNASLLAAAKLDASVSNLASIVVIAETDSSSVLLTGDARGDMIVEWLEDVGRLKPGGTVHFNIIKLPHHGSKRNITPEFFARVTADHYVVSGNGGHGNPDPKTLGMLFKARPGLDYKIHMTYNIDQLKENKTYKKKGNDIKIDEVLNSTKRIKTLQFPKTGERHIDVVL